jgi:VanZ family protein
MLQILYNYWKSISFTLLIFYLSFARPTTFADLNVVHITDKTAHYLVYVVYGLVLIYDYIKQATTRFSKTFFLYFCILSPIIMGGIIEIIQETFFKPRTAEWVDWLCDITGILTAWLIYSIVKNKTNLLSKL